MLTYDEAVKQLKSFCHWISDDYNRDSWFGNFFTRILAIQTQLNADTPDFDQIISSVNDIETLTLTEKGKAFRTTFGSISNHTDNILDVIETIGKHFLSLISTPKGPGHKQTQMRPMASLLRRLRQCA